MKLTIKTALGAALLTGLPALADKTASLDNYADIALAKYTDSLTTAQKLMDAVTAHTEAPSAEYLAAATALMVSDQEWMVSQRKDGGDARTQLTGDETAGLSAILTGMGSLSYGEQAGERMRLGVLLNDPEEEHDCFSDNTHNSQFHDALGVRNVYLGSYTRIDGTIVSGESLSSLLARADADVDAELRDKLDATMRKISEMKTAAEAGFAYDMMPERGNAAGKALIMGAVDGLVDQTRSIERAVAVLGVEGITFEGSDSLDDPNAVFQWPFPTRGCGVVPQHACRAVAAPRGSRRAHRFSAFPVRALQNRDKPPSFSVHQRGNPCPRPPALASMSANSNAKVIASAVR